MTARRVVSCKECGAHFSAPTDVVFDNGAPERGVDLRCPVCCLRRTYSGGDVLTTATAPPGRG